MMKTDNGRSVSVWMATADTPTFAPLNKDVSADVCVVGAGIAGLSTAYALAREGKRVVVLDDGPTAGGETARTTAHLTCWFNGVAKIEKLHGKEGLALAFQSHQAAVDRIERNAADEKIDCDFKRVSAYVFGAPEEKKGVEYLEKELDAAHRAGLGEAHWVEKAPLDGFDTGRCLCVPRQGQFHVLKYLAGLADAFRRRGGQLFNGTHASKIESDGKTVRVETKNGPAVTADAVVVATNSPVNDRVAIHTKQAAYRTYAIGFRVPRHSVVHSLYYDAAEPYHYVRLQAVPGEAAAGHDVLIVGGEDHKTGQARDPDQRYARLEEWAAARFPTIQGIEFRWSGQVMEPADLMGFIGRNPMDHPNVYVCTGDLGMGMTHGTIAGMLIPDLIQGRPSPWEKLYDPGRVTLKSAGKFAEENLNVAAMYAQWVKGGEAKGVGEIAPDTGAIMQRGLGKVAVYKDATGAVHECSAACPHLGCVVNWNYAERSWDCPCHGSRFDPYGKVINGPANTDLAKHPAE